jgi:hypothetical protein
MIIILSVQRIWTMLQAYVKSSWCCEFMMTSRNYFSFWLSRMLGATSCQSRIIHTGLLVATASSCWIDEKIPFRKCEIGVKWFTLVFVTEVDKKKFLPFVCFPRNILELSREIESVGITFLTYKGQGITSIRWYTMLFPSKFTRKRGRAVWWSFKMGRGVIMFMSDSDSF